MDTAFFSSEGQRVAAELRACAAGEAQLQARLREQAGAHIDADATGKLLASPDIGYLSEMMNFPGVLNGDAEVMAELFASFGLAMLTNNFLSNVFIKEIFYSLDSTAIR